MVFEIESRSRHKTHELQNRISRVVNDSLVFCADKYLLENIADNWVLQIDSMEIDIGEIEEDYLEQEVISRFSEAFCNELAARIASLRLNPLHASEGASIQQTFKSKLQLLEHFLVTGTLIWWADKATAWAMDTLIEELAYTHAGLLRGLIVKTGRVEDVRKRIAWQFKETTVKNIISVLEPEEAVYIFSYYDEVRSVQHKEQLIKTEEAVFARAILLFILNYLLVDRGSNFNRKAFVKNNVGQMAAWFNTSYTVLLQLFFDAIARELPPHIAAGSLYDIIRQLFAEEAVLIPQQPFIEEGLPAEDLTLSRVDLLNRYINIARYYLLYGSLPSWAGVYSEAALNNIMGIVLKEAPLTFLFVLRSLAAYSSVEERLPVIIGYDYDLLLKALLPHIYRFANELLAAIEQVRLAGQWETGATANFTEQLRKKLVIRIIRLPDTTITESTIIRAVTGVLVSAWHVTPAFVLQEVVYVIKTRYLSLTERDRLHKWIGQEMLLQEDAIATIYAAAANKEHAARIVESNGSVSLKDLLLFLLQYGSMPWWGQGIRRGRSQQRLMEALIASSPQDALQVFRLAGIQANLRKRFLSYFTTELVVSMISRTEPGKEATEIFYLITAIIQRFPGDISITSYQLNQLVLEQIWETLIAHQYRYFNSLSFYAHLFTALVVATGIDSKEWIAYFQQAMQAPAGTSYPDSLLLIINEWSRITGTEPLTIAQQDIITNASGDIVFNNQAEAEIIRVLTYFLQYGQLPVDIDAIETGVEQPVFILRMLVSLFVQAPGELASLWQLPGHDIRVKLYLYQLLAVQEGAAFQQLIHFLTEERRKDVLHYFKEVAVYTHDQPGNSFSLLLSKEAAGNNLSIIWDGEIIGNAKEVLQYFLQWNKLPDGISTHIKGADDQQVLLRNLVTELYRQDQHVFAGIWENSIANLLAKEQLYRVFNGYVQIQEQGIGGYLAEQHIKGKETIAAMQHPVATVAAMQNTLPGTAIGLSFVKDTSHGIVIAAGGVILATARDVLQYFLQWNKLPDTIQLYITGKEDLRLFLRNMMVALFQQEELVFTSIWNTVGASRQARWVLHDVMLGYTAVHERALALYLDSQREQEINALLTPHLQEYEAHTAETIQQLLAGYAENGEAMIQQLATTLPMATILQLYKQQYEHKEVTIIEWMEYAYAYIPGLIPDSYERYRWLAYFKQFTLLVIAGKYTITSGRAYLQSFFAFVYAAGGQPSASLIRTFHSSMVTPGITVLPWMSEMFRQLRDYIEKQTIVQAFNTNAIISSLAKTGITETVHNAQPVWQQQEKIRQETEQREWQQQERLAKEITTKAISINDKIYIGNAGLVLLHPFFGTLFTRIHYLSEGKFVNEEKQLRAPLLLQYMAYGRVEHEEHEIVLNKILCGVSPETPVSMDFVATPEEEALVTELFEVLFQHWDKMKNSSVAGFRASFLQREGTLEKTEDGWNLRVAQRGYDILLQTLPWAFGFIKTSWMHSIVTTEWI